jgi:predicted amino acid racemase
MRSLPCLTLNVEKYAHNVATVVKECHREGLGVYAVTKGFCAKKEMVDAAVKSGVDGIADSRIENLVKMGELPVPKILLRLPMPSEAEAVVKYADISFNTELTTLKALNKAAMRQNKRHGIVLMIEMGDLREGILPREFKTFIDNMASLDCLDMLGVGANFSCYGGIMATPEKLEQLTQLSTYYSKVFNLEDCLVSGGNSSSYYLLGQGALPKGINNLRLGELLVLGRETAFGKKVNGLYDDVAILEAEIIECKVKPSYPIGKMSYDAFGNVPEIEDRGDIVRAILALGKQDVNFGGLLPLDDDVIILGGSSDHLIVTFPFKSAYKTGDTLLFGVNYEALLQLTTSPYVKKEIRHDLT